jgi:hypothetical protein
MTLGARRLRAGPPASYILPSPSRGRLYVLRSAPVLKKLAANGNLTGPNGNLDPSNGN